uniref:Centromere protein M n=1 Tax=Callorhinchus milii TaxID=7868 RepID=A0A4W3GW84_CALMI
MVGVDGIPQDQLTEAILEESKSFTVNVRLAKKLPLPTENEESRPRIDLIVFLLDVRNQYSIEITKSSLAYVDVNFFLGKVCFLAVIDKSIKHQVVEMHAVKELADSYSSPLFFVELAVSTFGITSFVVVCGTLLCANCLENAWSLHLTVNPVKHFESS